MIQTMILPGTYIEVRDEGLITAGAVATGNIGIVGTANKGPVNKVQLISTLSEAREIFGDKNEWQDGKNNELTLIRALELIYQNGGKTVYAVRTGKDAVKASYMLTQNSKSTNLLKLEAKTEGTWGNKISIQIVSDTKDTTKPKTLKLIYEKIEESYQIETIEKLNEEINKNSNLINASIVDDANKESIPDDILSATKFTNGTNGKDDYKESLALLENEIINIVVLAGQNQDWADILSGHLTITLGIKRERIGIIGSKDDKGEHSLSSDRLIFTAPGITATENNKKIKLSGAYTAAAVAGLIASLPPKTSPTNKVLNIEGLSTEFNSSQLEQLVTKKVLAVEKRNGFRIVKGITTDDGAWKQITTRRIVDYAIYGVRSSCDPYIGKLNNDRVRGAMKATLDSFLTGMVEDEALVTYQLEVSATRQQEIEGKVMVNMTLQPTFSIDFIQVTMYLG